MENRSIPGFIKPEKPLADTLDNRPGRKRKKHKRPNYKNEDKSSKAKNGAEETTGVDRNNRDKEVVQEGDGKNVVETGEMSEEGAERVDEGRYIAEEKGRDVKTKKCTDGAILEDPGTLWKVSGRLRYSVGIIVWLYFTIIFPMMSLWLTSM